MGPKHSQREQLLLVASLPGWEGEREGNSSERFGTKY